MKNSYSFPSTAMAPRTFHDLLLDQMKDLYYAEHRILETLPKMADMATDEELHEAFEEHHKQTKGHIELLERAFKHLEEKPEQKLCEAMEGILKEGEEFLDADLPPEVRDAALIAAAQRVEHYEIAGYGVIRAFARLMRHDRVADLAQEILDEERETDEKLTTIAEATVNVAALEADPDRMEAEEEREGVTA